MFLKKILKVKRERIETQKRKVSKEQLIKKLKSPFKKRDFKLSISRPDRIALIAEVKKASPSRGIIRRNFNPLLIAQTFEANGADAISVLTEERFFQGRLTYLSDIKREVSVPILRKDFLIDEYQIYESKVNGADAILLIARLLSEKELSGYLTLAFKLDMDVVLEVHSEQDLNKALSVNAPIVGINNRDLDTLKLDLNTSERLMKFVPKDKFVIVESGITSHHEVLRLKQFGINAVLIGEAFIAAEDIPKKMKEVMEG